MTTTTKEEVMGITEVSKKQWLNFLAKKDLLSLKMRLVVEDAYALEKYWHIRADLVLAQVMKETGWGQKGSWFKNNNFAGLGVTGYSVAGEPDKPPMPVKGSGWYYDPASKKWVQGLVFEDEWAGMQALFAHHWAYLSKIWNPIASGDDPRYELAFQVRKGKPECVYITDYNDQWAVSRDAKGNIIPNHYGEEITEILYRVRDFK